MDNDIEKDILGSILEDDTDDTTDDVVEELDFDTTDEIVEEVVVEEEEVVTEPVVVEEEVVVEDTDINLTGKYDTDAKGNIVHNGKIIAKKGSERRIFENFRNKFQEQDKHTSRLADNLTTIIAAGKELQTRYKALQENKGYGEKLGLDETEIRQASDLAAQMKVDAKGAVKKLLTMVHLQGIDLSDLGVDGPLDGTAIADAAIKRYAAENAPKPTEAVEQTPEYKEATEFLNRNPDANQFTDVIAQAKTRFPSMSLDEIWTQIKTSAGKKRQAPPKPAARTKPTSVNKNTKLSMAEADPSMSFDDISKQILKDIKAMETS